MKRNILMFGCVIVCLILVSVSYQPLIAEEKPIVKPKREIQIVEEEDCGCNITINNPDYPEKLCEFLDRLHSNLNSFIIWLDIWLRIFPFRILGNLYYFIIDFDRSIPSIKEKLGCP